MEVSAIENPYRAALERSLDPVLDRVRGAAERAGRAPDSIKIVAVTKGHPLAAVEAALEAGLRDIGENRVEELEAKVQALDGRLAPTWHLIGHVQGRKAARAASLFELFHALDSIRLANRLSALATRMAQPLRVLVQVNASGEGSKGGLPLDSATEGLAEIVELPGLKVEGLMTMAPFTADHGMVRSTFRALRVVHESAKQASCYRGTELSMGMTNDFEIGIEEGSTLIRLGTALFGERPK